MGLLWEAFFCRKHTIFVKTWLPNEHQIGTEVGHVGRRNYLISPLGPQGCPSGAQWRPKWFQGCPKAAKMEPKWNTFDNFLHILDQQAAVLATKTVTLMSVAISDGMDNA